MGTPQYTEVKQSGSEEHFPTGSVRDNPEGKGRFDLISPIFLTRLAQHTENGAKRYGDRNWEKGQPVTRFFDSARRHLNKWQEGHRDEDHLAAAAWNIQGIIHTEEMVSRGLLDSELADMPQYVVPDDQPDCWELLDGTEVFHDPGPFNKPEPWLPDLPEGLRYVRFGRLHRSDYFLEGRNGMDTEEGFRLALPQKKLCPLIRQAGCLFEGSIRWIVERTS